jgi:uncharacterized protein YcbK (DUF882 family)
MDVQLSPHFKQSEFACKCGCGFNTVDRRLINGLELMREHIGHPIILTCGCRCPKHNAAVGGVITSYHLQGMAADITCPSVSLRELYKAAYLSIFGEGGIGLYPDKHFIHVDVGPQREWGEVTDSSGKQKRCTLDEALKVLKDE